MDLRQWQSECLELWMERGCRGLVEVVTGAGKTVMALEAIRRLSMVVEDLTTVILVPRIALADQWKYAITRYGFDPSCLWLSGSGLARNPERHRILLYVINTAWKELGDIEFSTPVLLVADEFHHYASYEGVRMLFRLRNKVTYTLGLSATAGKAWILSKLSPLLGEVFYRYDVSNAISNGVISGFDVMNIATELDSQEWAEYVDVSDKISKTMKTLHDRHPYLMADKELTIEQKLKILITSDDEEDRNLATMLTNLLFRRRKIIARSDARLKACLCLLSQISPERRIIVFSESIEQIDILESWLDCELSKYHSRMRARDKIAAIEDFKSGRTRILLSCKALEEGLDVPDADVGIFLSSSDSERQRIQRLGRLLRKSGGKDRSMLYYIYSKGTIERYYIVEDYPASTKEVNAEFDGRKIVNSQYNEFARILLKATSKKGNDALKRVHRALLRGSLLADYLRSDEDLVVRRDQAQNSEDRDYYQTMRMVAHLVSKRYNLNIDTEEGSDDV